MPPAAIASSVRRAIASGRASPVLHVQAEQELDRHRLRELGRAAPAAVARVEAALQAEQRRVEQPVAGLAAAAIRPTGPASSPADRLRERRAGLLDLRRGARATPRLTPASTWRNDGSPWRGWSGKYVPP